MNSRLVSIQLLFMSLETRLNMYNLVKQKKKSHGSCGCQNRCVPMCESKLIAKVQKFNILI